jgi:hypothetical protein
MDVRAATSTFKASCRGWAFVTHDGPAHRVQLSVAPSRRASIASLLLLRDGLRALAYEAAIDDDLDGWISFEYQLEETVEVPAVTFHDDQLLRRARPVFAELIPEVASRVRKGRSCLRDSRRAGPAVEFQSSERSDLPAATRRRWPRSSPPRTGVGPDAFGSPGATAFATPIPGPESRNIRYFGSAAQELAGELLFERKIPGLSLFCTGISGKNAVDA